MSTSANLKNSSSPQAIIEKLARKRITEEEAEAHLKPYWGRAYDTPTVVRFVRDIFRTQNSAGRVAR